MRSAWLLAAALLAVPAAAQTAPTADLSWDLPAEVTADGPAVVVPVEVSLTFMGLCAGAQPATVEVALEADRGSWAPEALVFEIPAGQGIIQPAERRLTAILTIAADEPGNTTVAAAARITQTTGCSGSAQAELSGNTTARFPPEAVPTPSEELALPAVVGILALIVAVRRSCRE